MENASLLVPASARIFVTTRWTVIADCRQADEAKARVALEELCRSYWQPIYICIRHRGYTAHDAQDLTQDFFLRLLNGAWVRHLDKAKGRFRAYLSTALQNFLHDHYRKRWTLRRGRGAAVVSFETLEAEQKYALLPAVSATPESLYEREWAKAVIEHTLEQLRIELRAAGKEALLDHFDAILAADTLSFPYEETAQSIGVSVGALHVALHRWRQRFNALLREEIGRTVLSKTEIDDELLYLQRLFARGE